MNNGCGGGGGGALGAAALVNLDSSVLLADAGIKRRVSERNPWASGAGEQDSAGPLKTASPAPAFHSGSKHLQP